MVMFVLNEDGTNFFDFNVEKQPFRIGEVIEHERLNGKHIVVNLDPATVTVKPIKD